MNCAFCDVAAEPLECGHVICATCQVVVGDAAPCPVSQMCDGGGIMSMRFVADGFYRTETDEGAELAFRRERLAHRQATKARVECILDELLRVEDSRAAICKAVKAPHTSAREALELERLAVLEFLEREIKTEESAIDVLELRHSFREAGHESLLRPLAPQRCLITNGIPLPGHLWVAAFLDLFRPTRKSSMGDIVEPMRSGKCYIYGVEIEVDKHELVRVGKGRMGVRIYQRTSGALGSRGCEKPFVEVPLAERYRMPHVPGSIWACMSNLKLDNTGIAFVYALYDPNTSKQNVANRYLMFI